MKLTKDEEALILSRRKKEEESRPVKEGFLKEDLYDYDVDGRTNNLGFVRESEFQLCNNKQRQHWIAEFMGHFNIVLRSGCKFVCYIEDGKELWYDDANYGLEEMNEKWAKKYLDHIGPYHVI